MRKTVHRERPDRSIVNAGIGIVNAGIGIVNAGIGRLCVVRAWRTKRARSALSHRSSRARGEMATPRLPRPSMITELSEEPDGTGNRNSA